MFFGDESGIALVALVDEAVNAVLLRVLPGLLDPVGDQVLEGLRVVRVKHQDHCMGSLVVRTSQPSEPFLPGSVPDLQLHVVAFDVHRPQ